MCYDRARKLSLEEVIPYIKQENNNSQISLKLWCSKIEEEIKVRLTSSRMKLIGRTQECAACKIQGSYFWAESNSKCPVTGKPNAWHLNLYALNHNGKPVMMTLDHIHPKSRGGTRSKKNIQLLCETCNMHKRDLNLSPEEIVQIRITKDPILGQFLKDAGVI